MLSNFSLKVKRKDFDELSFVFHIFVLVSSVCCISQYCVNLCLWIPRCGMSYLWLQRGKNSYQNSSSILKFTWCEMFRPKIHFHRIFISINSYNFVKIQLIKNAWTNNFEIILNFYFKISLTTEQSLFSFKNREKNTITDFLEFTLILNSTVSNSF